MGKNQSSQNEQAREFHFSPPQYSRPTLDHPEADSGGNLGENQTYCLKLTIFRHPPLGGRSYPRATSAVVVTQGHNYARSEGDDSMPGRTGPLPFIPGITAVP